MPFPSSRAVPADPMARLTDELSRTLHAFDLDLLPTSIDQVTVVAMSEFGRRIAENASRGLDHGHGGCMLLMGGGIAGGRVLHRWPGLAPPALDRGDLAVTIDYRDVLAEVLARRAGKADLDQVFPGHTPSFSGVTV